MKQCKGTIVFDIDGVLLDFYASFLAWYNQKHGTTFCVTDLKRYDIAKGLCIDPQEIVDFHAEDACGHLPLLEQDIPLVLSRLKEKGYRIVFNTDFPLAFIGKRCLNLKEHGLNFDEIHFRYKEYVTDLYDDILLVVEDNPYWIHYYIWTGMNVAVPIRPYLREEEISCSVVWYETLSGAFSVFLK